MNRDADIVPTLPVLIPDAWLGPGLPLLRNGRSRDAGMTVAVGSAILLVRPMFAPRPAAGPAFAVKQVRANPLDLASARFLLFRGLDPANPFVACEGCETGPRR